MSFERFKQEVDKILLTHIAQSVGGLASFSDSFEPSHVKMNLHCTKGTPIICFAAFIVTNKRNSKVENPVNCETGASKPTHTKRTLRQVQADMCYLTCRSRRWLCVSDAGCELFLFYSRLCLAWKILKTTNIFSILERWKRLLNFGSK